MFWRPPRAKEKYVSLDRASDALRLSMSQLQQYLVTGQLYAPIIHHKPSDYKERREVISKNGGTAVHTRTSRTALSIVAPGHKVNPLTYLHPDDTARVLLNKTPHREMLICKLFYDRTLSPGAGIYLSGDSAIPVAPSDLVISSEELGRFAKAARIRIKPAAGKSIDLPPKPWCDRPVGRVVLGVLTGLILAITKWWLDQP